MNQAHLTRIQKLYRKLIVLLVPAHKDNNIKNKPQNEETLGGNKKMGIKAKLGLSMATAALGISLVGGGTFAYFSATATNTGTFAAGEIDLKLNNIITQDLSVNNLKPGDSWVRSFNLKNTGSVEIGKVILTTNYTVTNKVGAADNSLDLGHYIRVDFLRNYSTEPGLFDPSTAANSIVYSTKLEDLKGAALDTVVKNLINTGIPVDANTGLKPNEDNNLTAVFTFVDDGTDQTQFEGDKLNLTWSFEARTTEGSLALLP